MSYHEPSRNIFMEITDRIKQTASIVEIASQYTTLKKRGSKYVGLCPFHPDKDPSFTVDEDKKLYHCFGCGAGGDIFTLVMEKEQLSFQEAIRFLARKYNIPLPRTKTSSQQALKLEEKIFSINQSTMAFFRKNLFNTKEGEKARNYLKKRGISEETLQELKIGYALHSWDSLLSFFKQKGTDINILEKAGLIIKKSGRAEYYDRFRGRVIFPIFNLTGQVVAFGGRTIYDETPKYLNSPDTPVYTKGNLLYGLNFNKEEIRQKEEIILVEGYTDFLALYQSGFKNVAASLGTSLTGSQINLALRFAPSMTVCYDGDAAGRKAALRAVSLGFEKGIRTDILLLPEGSDPDSFIKKHGIEEFKKKIEQKIPGLKFLIYSLKKEIKPNIPEEKAKLVRKVIEEIGKIPDALIRSEYLKQACEMLSIEETLMRSLLLKKPAANKSAGKKYFLPAEKRLIQIIFQNGPLAEYILQNIEPQDYQHLRSEPVFSLLKKAFSQKKAPLIHEIRQKITPDLFSDLAEILLEKFPALSLEEVKDCLNALKEVSLERTTRELKIQISQLERMGKNDELAELVKKLQEIKNKQSLLIYENRN